MPEIDKELEEALAGFEPIDFDPAGVLGDVAVRELGGDHEDLDPAGFAPLAAVLDDVDQQPKTAFGFVALPPAHVNRDDDEQVADAVQAYLEGGFTLGATSSRGYGPTAMYAIYAVVDRVIPSMEISGIYARKSGYHNCRADLPGGDYSVQAPADRRGDQWAAAGIDLKFSDRDMLLVTARLMKAFKANDPRIEPCREFFGTLNGRTVTGWNRYATGRPVGYVTSDSSHLWHIHISVFRDYANDRQKMLSIAQVMVGAPADAPDWPPATDLPATPDPEEDDMPTVKDIFNTDDAIPQENGEITGNPKNPGIAFATYLKYLWRKAVKLDTDAWKIAEAQKVRTDALAKDVADVKAALERIEAALPKA